MRQSLGCTSKWYTFWGKHGMFIDLINRPPVGGEPFQMGRISDPCNLCWAGAPEGGCSCGVLKLNRDLPGKIYYVPRAQLKNIQENIVAFPLYHVSGQTIQRGNGPFPLGSGCLFYFSGPMSVKSMWYIIGLIPHAKKIPRQYCFFFTWKSQCSLSNLRYV